MSIPPPPPTLPSITPPPPPAAGTPVIRLELPSRFSLEGLVDLMVLCEREYRRGNPIVNDAVYDFKLLPELKKRDPNHPLLSHIGADDFSTTLDTSLMYGVIYPSGSICETKVTRDVALSEKATHGGQIIKFVGDNACIVDLDDMITDHNLNLIKERKK